MKIRTFLAGLLMLGLTASAQANPVVTLGQIQAIEAIRTTTHLAAIEWKIGDAQTYKVTLGMGLDGTMEKEAFKEEGNGVWVRQQLKLPIMNDSSEMLIDRNSGKILKYLHNGKEEKLPDGQLEIVSTKNEVIEVPAGKFKVLYILAKSKDVQKMEIWMNPREISLDGAAKVFIDQGMMKITLELTKFVKN